MVSLVGGVTLGLCLLVMIAILVLAAPGTAAGSPVGDPNPSDMSPFAPASLSGDAALLKACTTYYLRGYLINVGSDGNRPAADTSAPLASVPTVVSAKLNADLEIARFYSTPPFSGTWQISEDITGLLWINSSLPEASLNLKLFDYNPLNGDRVLLGEFPVLLLSAGEANVEFHLTPPAAPISAEHRLLLVLEGKKGSPPPEVELRYDSVNRASQFTICRRIDGSPPPTSTLYLPLIMANKVGPMTALYVESSNTGGIHPARILDPSTNQELLSCTIGDNVTQFCGNFPTPTNGTYKITAQTARCGFLQGTFNDALPGGTVRRRIFCN